jgi:hypothetical protein
MTTEKTITFPLRYKATRAFIEEAAQCEYGAWEDAGRPADGDVWYHDGPHETNVASSAHAVSILDRHATVIELRDKYELEELYQSLLSGTLEEYRPRALDSLARRMTADLLALGAVRMVPRPFRWASVCLPDGDYRGSAAPD